MRTLAASNACRRAEQNSDEALCAIEQLAHLSGMCVQSEVDAQGVSAGQVQSLVKWKDAQGPHRGGCLH